jgi:hypothetical protein
MLAPMDLQFTRATMLLVFAAHLVVGLIYFRGSNLRDPRLVTKSTKIFWHPLRMLDPTEWTAAGLRWRRWYLLWMLSSSITLVVLFRLYVWRRP